MNCRDAQLSGRDNSAGQLLAVHCTRLALMEEWQEGWYCKREGSSSEDMESGQLTRVDRILIS